MEAITEAAKNVSENYAFLLSKALNNLESASTLSEIRKIFSDFHQNFTMIPKLWLKWLELEQQQTFPDFDAANLEKNLKEIKAKAKKDFRSFKFFEYNDEEWKKGLFEESMYFDVEHLTRFRKFARLHPSTASQTFENALKFPHQHLQKTKLWCEKYATRPFPCDVLRQYRKATESWNLLFEEGYKVVWNWKSIIISMNDKNYIIRSFEHCLYKFPHFTSRWKGYLKYLHDIDYKAALINVYSRYCRLFTDDLEMRKAYIIFVKKNLPEISHFWGIPDADLKIFIQYFGKIPDTLFPKELPEIEFDEVDHSQFSNRSCVIDSQTPSSPLYFTPKNSVTQKFSLPFDVMNCIISTCNFATKQKLYQSCKFFYQKSQKPLCHRLGIFKTTLSTYFEQSLFLNSNTFLFDGINGAILTNMLQIVLSGFPNATSMILSKISECQVLHLQLQNQNLTDAEFAVLVGERTRALFLGNVFIRDKSHHTFTVDEIIEKIPNSFYIVIKPSPSMYTEKTAENLGYLKRKKNIIQFWITCAPQGFQDDIFLFFQNSALRSASISIDFAANVTNEFRESFKARIHQALENESFKLYIS